MFFLKRVLLTGGEQKFALTFSYLIAATLAYLCYYRVGEMNGKHGSQFSFRWLYFRFKAASVKGCRFLMPPAPPEGTPELLN